MDPHGIYDKALRRLLARHAADVAGWLLGKRPVEVRQEETAFAVFTGRSSDKLLDVRLDERTSVLLHVELQTGGDHDMPQRMSEYLVWLAGVLKRPEHQGKRLASVVVYLDRECYSPDPGLMKLDGELGSSIRISYGVVRLWELDPGPLLALAAPGVLPFVPLMAGKPVELLLKSQEQILAAPEALAGGERKRELLAIQAILASRVIKDPDYLKKLCSEIQRMGENYFLDLLRQEGMAIGLERGKIQGREEGRQEGREEGREEGARTEVRRLLCRLLERRFGEVPAGLEAEIEKIPELERLEELHETAAVARDLHEFLAALRGR
jgi:predicted transposase YdaD